MKFFFLIILYLPFILKSATHKLNDDHSELFFSVEYLNISEVTGRFKNISGFVKLHENKFIESIELTIDANSVDTGNRMRDGHLKGTDFFNTKVHPYIIFKSSQIQKLSSNKYKSSGLLIIKNIKKPFTIFFHLSDEVEDTWGYKSQFVKFNSSLTRSDFNLKWNKTLVGEKYLVGDVVKFWGALQLQLINESTPTNKHMIPDTKYIRTREKVSRGEIKQVAHPSDSVKKPAPLKGVANVKDVKIDFNHKTKSNFRDSTVWWSALFVLGFLGFVSVIIVGYFSKTIFIDLFSQKYEENGIWGHFIDLLMIAFVIVYSTAFWIVGWGS